MVWLKVVHLKRDGSKRDREEENGRGRQRKRKRKRGGR